MATTLTRNERVNQAINDLENGVFPSIGAASEAYLRRPKVHPLSASTRSTKYTRITRISAEIDARSRRIPLRLDH